MRVKAFCKFRGKMEEIKKFFFERRKRNRKLEQKRLTQVQGIQRKRKTQSKVEEEQRLQSKTNF